MTAISFAADRKLAVVPTAAGRLPSTPVVLVMPDARNEAFVFAKGQLQDGGFAGAPLIKLTLQRNKHYGPKGEPEDTSPYAPTADRLAGSS